MLRAAKRIIATLAPDGIEVRKCLAHARRASDHQELEGGAGQRLAKDRRRRSDGKTEIRQSITRVRLGQQDPIALPAFPSSSGKLNGTDQSDVLHRNHRPPPTSCTSWAESLLTLSATSGQLLDPGPWASPTFW